MKAIIFTKYGSPDVLKLQDIEKPTIKENQMLIKVHASSVTPMDYRYRRGKAPLWPVSRIMMGFCLTTFLATSKNLRPSLNPSI